MTLSSAGLEKQLFLQWRPMYDSNTRTHIHTFLILVSGQLQTQLLYHQGKCCFCWHPPLPLQATKAGPDTLEKEKFSYNCQELYLNFTVIQPVDLQSQKSWQQHWLLCNLTARNTANVVITINHLNWQNKLQCLRTTNIEFYVLLTMHLITIFVNNQLDAQFFFLYLFIPVLYMFWATKCSSSGESIVINMTSGICHST